MIKSTILEGQTAILSHPGYVYKPKTSFNTQKNETNMIKLMKIQFQKENKCKKKAYKRILDGLKWRFDLLEL